MQKRLTVDKLEVFAKKKLSWQDSSDIFHNEMKDDYALDFICADFSIFWRNLSTRPVVSTSLILPV